MGQEQALRRGSSDDTPATQAFKPVERKAPESKDILKQLDGSLKEKTSREDRKREILRRCGCL